MSSRAPGFQFDPLASHDFVASCPLDFEPELVAEYLEKRSAWGLNTLSEPTPIEGGIEFSGSLAEGLAMNRILKIANRVLLRVRSFQAKDFSRLEAKIKNTPWNLFLAPFFPCGKYPVAAQEFFINLT